MAPHILIADDDTELCRLLADFLRLENYQVSCVHDGEQAVSAALEGRHDLLVLDIMLPGRQGLDVLRTLRLQSALPVVMLTARGDDTDRILGLELGADDYLPKPCNPKELAARIKAVLRRASQSGEQTRPVPLQVGVLMLDAGRRHATVNGKTLNLTSTEFDVLHLLMQHSGIVVSKEAISEQVLKRRLTAYDRSIDVHISNIRKKLSDADLPSAIAREWIKNIRGVGYQLLNDQVQGQVQE